MSNIIYPDFTLDKYDDEDECFIDLHLTYGSFFEKLLAEGGIKDIGECDSHEIELDILIKYSEGLRAMGERLYFEDSFELAREQLNKAVKLANTRAMHILAYLEQRYGNFELALSLYLKALSHPDKHLYTFQKENILENMAIIYYEVGEYEKGLFYHRKISSYKTQYLEAYETKLQEFKKRKGSKDKISYIYNS